MPHTAKKQLLLIINPVAGKIKNHKRFSDVIASFEQKEYLVKAIMTSKQGDAADFAAELSSGFDVVVCAGGDGTVHETITGLVKSNFTGAFGFIPTGTTNYFGICNHLSSGVDIAVERILESKSKSINIGKFDNDYFAFVAAFGLFSDLPYSTSQKVKNFIGYPAYVLEGMKRLPKLKPIKMRVIAKNHTYENKYIFGAVSNYSPVVNVITKHKKSTFVNDGTFEVILIHEPKNSIEWSNIINSLISGSYKSSLIEHFTTDSLEIETEESIPWTLDGELEISRTKVQIEKIINAVNLIIS